MPDIENLIKLADKIKKDKSEEYLKNIKELLDKREELYIEIDKLKPELKDCLLLLRKLRELEYVGYNLEDIKKRITLTPDNSSICFAGSCYDLFFDRVCIHRSFCIYGKNYSEVSYDIHIETDIYCILNDDGILEIRDGNKESDLAKTNIEIYETEYYQKLKNYERCDYLKNSVKQMALFAYFVKEDIALLKSKVENLLNEILQQGDKNE